VSRGRETRQASDESVRELRPPCSSGRLWQVRSTIEAPLAVSGSQLGAHDWPKACSRRPTGRGLARSRESTRSGRAASRARGEHGKLPLYPFGIAFGTLQVAIAVLDATKHFEGMAAVAALVFIKGHCELPASRGKGRTSQPYKKCSAPRKCYGRGVEMCQASSLMGPRAALPPRSGEGQRSQQCDWPGGVSWGAPGPPGGPRRQS